MWKLLRFHKDRFSIRSSGTVSLQWCSWPCWASHFRKPTKLWFHSADFDMKTAANWTRYHQISILTRQQVFLWKQKLSACWNLLTIMKRWQGYRCASRRPKYWQRNQLTRRPTLHNCWSKLSTTSITTRIWRSSGSTVVKWFGDVEKSSKLVRESLSLEQK